MEKIKISLFDKVIMWILDRIFFEHYVYRVRDANARGRTYLPYPTSNGPESGQYPQPTREMTAQDRLGQWSLGWRPPK